MIDPKLKSEKLRQLKYICSGRKKPVNGIKIDYLNEVNNPGL